MVVSFVLAESQPERSRLALLCRGFLVCSDRDPTRAEAFLSAFLRELAWAETSLAAPKESPTSNARDPFGRRPSPPAVHQPGPDLPVSPS